MTSMRAAATAAYQIHDQGLTSQELFELVACRDYEALSVLYGRVGLHAVRHHLVHLTSEQEEKMDDSGGGFWQSPSRRNNNNSNNSNTHRDEQTQMYRQLLRELSLFVTEKEQVEELPPAKKKSKLEVSADAERLLRDAVAAFSDTRPPTNFVVYEDTSEEDDMTTGAGAGADEEEADDEEEETQDNSNNQNNNNNNATMREQQQHRRPGAMEAALEGPPIFDGSVANATPQTGGAGTILHLACALDEPLCLAFGLAMGADARACHTAFRRLMIHEASCNGSLQCLTLLLELGRQYGSSTLRDNDADAKLPPRLSRHARTFELPFLPRRLDRSDILAPLHMYALQGGSTAAGAPSQTQRMNRATSFLGKKKKEPAQPCGGNNNKGGGGADFLTLLHSFRLYAQQVKRGELSELDAARKVLQLATLSESSKTSLARSCAFHHTSSTSPELSLRHRTRQIHNNTSDGHGNTPLHWAAFKNETECVSLLLSYGANPNARAHPSGWTPLHDAAYSNSKEAVELLIEAGAHVDARANSGATPLCFAAQEDSAKSAELLLRKGADLSARCAGGSENHTTTSRFSGYTPLHYCAHYNAKAAAKVLLRHSTARVAMEIPDLNDRLPIHVAVARGSSTVLLELLHAGARVVTRTPEDSTMSDSSSTASSASTPSSPTAAEPSTPRQQGISNNNGNAIVVSTPVSSPVLRSMIPQQPVTSSKPWNCLTQQSIDECRQLIHQAELNWSPMRHRLFTPHDRRAVLTLLVTGKRLEQSHGMFLDLWPQVLSFCGRGWFDPIDPSQSPTVILPDPNTATPSTLYYSTVQTEDAIMTSPSQEEDYDESLTLPNL